MPMKRDATQTIWRTVVFAGAMLGAPACTKKQAQTTPSNNQPPVAAEPAQPAAPVETATPASTSPPAAPPAEPPADVCSGDRPRGTDEDFGGGVGRGFVLS
jgi:hypothetical protein